MKLFDRRIMGGNEKEGLTWTPIPEEKGRLKWREISLWLDPYNQPRTAWPSLSGEGGEWDRQWAQVREGTERTCTQLSMFISQHVSLHSQDMGTLLGSLNNFEPKALEIAYIVYQGHTPWYMRERVLFTFLSIQKMFLALLAASVNSTLPSMRMENVLQQWLTWNLLHIYCFACHVFISRGSVNSAPFCPEAMWLVVGLPLLQIQEDVANESTAFPFCLGRWLQPSQSKWMRWHWWWWEVGKGVLYLLSL